MMAGGAWLTVFFGGNVGTTFLLTALLSIRTCFGLTLEDLEASMRTTGVLREPGLTLASDRDAGRATALRAFALAAGFFIALATNPKLLSHCEPSVRRSVRPQVPSSASIADTRLCCQDGGGHED